MSSFNVKGHSGVIEAGDECTIFFVIRATYIDDLFGAYKPISLPIRCVYDDYNQFRLPNDHDAYNEYAVKESLEHIKKIMDEDEAATPSLITFDYVFKLIHEERLTADNIPIRVFAVHQSYYKSVVDAYAPPNPNKPNKWLQTARKTDNQVLIDLSDIREMSIIAENITVPHQYYIFGVINRKIRKDVHSQDSDIAFSLLVDCAGFFSFMDNIADDFTPVMYAGWLTRLNHLIRHYDMCLKIAVDRKTQIDNEYAQDFSGGDDDV